MIEKPTIKSTLKSDVSPCIQINGEGTIYYTIDGTEPTTESILYTEPFDYPINATIKAIAIQDEEQSEVSIYQCNIPWYRHINGDITYVTQLSVKQHIDCCNLAFGPFTNCEVLDIMYGCVENLGNFRIKGYIYPFGFDLDEKFPNAPGWLIANDNFASRVKRGQVIQRNGWLKISDGSKWHDFQQIYSGTFANKPTVEQGIPVGFAYFCTDKQTSEGESNGIMIYHKGNDIWVDALGRVIS